MRPIKYLTILIFLMVVISLPVFNLPIASIPAAGAYSPKPDDTHVINRYSSDLSDISLFLEEKISDAELIDKIKNKLTLLSDEEIRLISSLCERIRHHQQSAATEVAFLLITTLIILS